MSSKAAKYWTPSWANFLEFVNEQPDDRTIDHYNERVEKNGGPERTSLSAWCGCAIGEWYHYGTGQWLTLDAVIEVQNRINNGYYEFLPTLLFGVVDEDEDNELAELIKDVGVILKSCEPQTYGELKRLLVDSDFREEVTARFA